MPSTLVRDTDQKRYQAVGHVRFPAPRPVSALLKSDHVTPPGPVIGLAHVSGRPLGPASTPRRACSRRRCRTCDARTGAPLRTADRSPMHARNASGRRLLLQLQCGYALRVIRGRWAVGCESWRAVRRWDRCSASYPSGLAQAGIHRAGSKRQRIRGARKTLG
jgi:hypothetical protein